MVSVLAGAASSAREVEAPLDIGALYAEHGAFIARSIQRMLGDGTHVDDLLQETFIVALRRADSFAGRSHVRTWLYGIARRLCMRHHRDRGRREQADSRLAESSPVADAPLQDDLVEEQQRLHIAQEVITSLPIKLREVLILFELEGLEGGEIATLLEIAEGTVWARLSRGRRLFLDRLERRLRAPHRRVDPSRSSR